MSVSNQSVGFIGLGTMGWPMAANVARAGYALKVLDADPEVTRRFADEYGVEAVGNVSGLSECEFIITMLPTGQIVKAVLTEGDGQAFLEKAKAGIIVVDMSSSAPEGTRELAQLLSQNQISLVDAPVSGARPRAESGTLTIMMGSDDENALQLATPLMQSMGSDVFRCGGSGTGHAVKALNNYMAASAYVAMAESLLIADRFGLDRQTLVDIVNVSTGKSFISDIVATEHLVGEKYATGFALGLLTKDVGIAAKLAESVGLDAPQSRLVREQFEKALEELGYTEDHTAAIKSWNNSLQEN